MKPLTVVLLRPPQPYLFVDSHYPIGIALLGTKLHKAGHRVLGIAVDSSPAAEIPAADWYLVSSTTPSYPAARSLARRLRNYHPAAQLAIGGPHASALPEEVLADAVWDYVVVGEADDTIASILSGDVGKGIVRCDPPMDIDEIPLRSLFRPTKLHLTGRRAANVMFTRGCPYHCRFCASGGTRHRRRSEASMLAETEMLKNQGYGGIVLNDDTPILDDHDLERICAIMSRAGMLFRLNLRVEQVTASRVRLLSHSGCVQVNIGVEMPDDRILQQIDKRTSLERIFEAFHILEQHQLPAKALLIHGLPGTGYEAAQAMVDFVRRARPQYVMLSSFFPMPGSPYFREMRGQLERAGISQYEFLYHGCDGNSKYVHHLPNGVLSGEELDRLKVEIWDKISALGITRIDRGDIGGLGAWPTPPLPSPPDPNAGDQRATYVNRVCPTPVDTA